MLGGRWNPPNSFATLYTATDVATVDAEFFRQLVRARLRPEDMRPRDLATIELDLSRVLDLRDPETQRALQLRPDDLTGDDNSITRAIGEAAQHLGYEAVVAPSAAGGPGYVVALFLSNRAATSAIEVVAVDRYRPGPTPRTPE